MPQPDIATIADIVRVHAANRPDAVALVVDDRTITFAALDKRSSQAAQAFRLPASGSATESRSSKRTEPSSSKSSAAWLNWVPSRSP